MKRTISVLTAVSIGLFLGLRSFGTEHDPPSSVQLAADTSQSVSPPANSSPASHAPLTTYGFSWIRAVTEPILSLRLMRRAVSSNLPEPTQKTSLDDLLTANLTITGLGPIRIGMTLNEVAEIGLKLTPVKNAQGECQYLRATEALEPIGFMAVDNRIIRIDVWPGSFTQTKRGAHIGSTEAEVYTYYPGKLEVETNPRTQGKTMTFVPSEAGEDLYRLVFETDAQGRVVKFKAGQFPAVTWPGECQ